jgi:hypothetical protein
MYQAQIKFYELQWFVIGEWVLHLHDDAGPVYEHYMDIDTQTDGSFSGTGYYVPSPTYTTTITGTVTGTEVDFTIDYDTTALIYTMADEIDTTDGSMSGTHTSNMAYQGWWESVSGAAYSEWVLLFEYDFIGMPPYGLGQPLFGTVFTHTELVSAHFYGGADLVFGNQVEDTLTLTFTDDIFKDGTDQELYFTGSTPEYIRTKATWTIVDNVLTISIDDVTQLFTTPRPKVGDIVTGFKDIEDSYGYPIVVPSGGVTIISFP